MASTALPEAYRIDLDDNDDDGDEDDVGFSSGGTGTFGSFAGGAFGGGGGGGGGVGGGGSSSDLVMGGRVGVGGSGLSGVVSGVGGHRKRSSKRRTVAIQFLSYEMGEALRADLYAVVKEAYTAHYVWETQSGQRQMAAAIKEELDTRHGEPWHVIVGSSFACFVTHETDAMAYLSVGPTQVFVFKHG